MDLGNFFYPKSVAIIGSMSPGKLGAILAGQIVAGGFHGDLVAVNPKCEGMPGVPAYSFLSDIPHPPDLALVVSPATTVAPVLEECGKAGIRSAVIITSGFSEAGNRQGEQQLVEIARQHGIRFIGPNCAGIASAGYDFFPTLELRTPAGGVGLVSQSGALGGVVLGCAQQRKLGISKFISYGNGADLNQDDFLRYLARDEETKVVAVYVESVTDGRAFMDALAECARSKPVLVIKAGRTSAGTRATASHTGSMAGSDAVYAAAIRGSGAIRVSSVEALMDLCEGFIHLPHPGGKRLAIVTNSGGPGVLAADLAEELGLSVPEPSPRLQSQLRTFLPAHCSIKNPFDLTVEGTREGYQKTLQTVLQEYDAAVAINVGTAYLDNLSLARGVVDGAHGCGKPVIASFVPGQLMAESDEHLKQNGIPALPSGERAVSVLAAMAHHADHRHAGSYSLRASPAAKNYPLPGDGQMLEPQVMDWLRQNDIPVPPFFTAREPEEAVLACDRLGYPAVMKVVSPDILHKSDVGGVIVGIRDATAARQAFVSIQQAAQGKDFRGVIVYPMISDAQEVLLGLSTDPQFGAVVAFGLGGIFTEIMHDVVLRVAPIDAEEAFAMIHEIRGVALLTGARGRPPRDLHSLAKTISTFSYLPFKYPEIGEVDLNPVFLFPKGLVVGDARLIKKAGEAI